MDDVHGHKGHARPGARSRRRRIGRELRISSDGGSGGGRGGGGGGSSGESSMMQSWSKGSGSNGRQRWLLLFGFLAL
jgi:hypothetical protein